MPKKPFYLKMAIFAIAPKVANYNNNSSPIAQSGHTGLENLDVPLYIRPAAVKAFATLCNIR